MPVNLAPFHWNLSSKKNFDPQTRIGGETPRPQHPRAAALPETLEQCSPHRIANICLTNTTSGAPAELSNESRTNSKDTILSMCQSCPSLAMHSGLMSGLPLELRNSFEHSEHQYPARRLLGSSKAAVSSDSQSHCFSKLNDAETNFFTKPFHARGYSHHTRFQACASSSKLPMELSCAGRGLRMFSISLDNIRTDELFCPASTCSRALSESGAFLAILAASKSLLCASTTSSLGKSHSILTCVSVHGTSEMLTDLT